MYEPFGPRDGLHTLALLSAPIEVTRLLKSALGSAIGRSLRDQYDAVATPMPSQLVALVNQLEMQK
jgi:hypothetical protein